MPRESEYVINPATGRIVRKGGRAYNRWRRAHPLEEEPQVVPAPNHVRRVRTTNHTPRQVRSASVSRWSPSPASYLACCSTASAPTPVRKPKPALERRLSGPPPLSRCDAWGEEMFHAYRPNPQAPNTEHAWPEKQAHDTVSEDSVRSHDTIMDLLQDQGRDLLDAYNDPNVDFMQVLAKAYGLQDK